MREHNGPDEVCEVRALAERVRAVWNGEPRSLSLIKPYDFHKAPQRSWDQYVAFRMGWGAWWCLPAFGFSSGVICLALDSDALTHEAAVLRESEGQANVQCSHIRHYLKRSYLDDHLYPSDIRAWSALRLEWPDRKPRLVAIHHALGNTDELEDFEHTLYDDVLFPCEGMNRPEQAGRVLSRVDPSPHAARLAPIARAVQEGGEPDLEADVGPWRPLVASMTANEAPYSPRQALAILGYPGNIDISGQAIYIVRFPNRNNAQSALSSVAAALTRGVASGVIAHAQQGEPMFRAYARCSASGFQDAATKLAARGDHRLAWNALLTANLYVPLSQQARAWLPLFKQALGIARAANFRFVPVLEWMWSNYVAHNPDVDRSGV